MLRTIWVYRENPKHMCYDFETKTDIVGAIDQPQEVQNTIFVRNKIHEGVLVQVEAPADSTSLTPPDQDKNLLPAINYTVDEFSKLSADEQKGELTRLEVTGDDSNQDKRAALYADYLTSRGS